MTDVFISYSHVDEPALKQLKRFLTPLERDGRIAYWDDSRIKEGDDWQQQINMALDRAKAAILLISQDFIASDFIASDELPALIEKHRSGACTILPVFINHSNVKLVRAELAAIQGYGSPDKPLSDHDYTQRDRIYAKLSERLTKLLDGTTTAVPRSVAPATIVAPSDGSPRKTFDLLVKLSRNGSVIEATYQLPNSEPFLSHQRPWHNIEALIAPINRVLDDNDLGNIELQFASQAQNWGHALFELLFGTESAHLETIFRKVFHRPLPAAKPSPVHAPLRIQIATDHLLLASLPWRLTVWEHRRLVDHKWIFVNTTDRDAPEDVITSPQSDILLVGPSLTSASHFDALTEMFKTIWPTHNGETPYLRRAFDKETLVNALQGQCPHFIYVYTSTKSLAGGVLAFSLDQNEVLSVPEFATLCRDCAKPPKAIYFNTCGAIMNKHDWPNLFNQKVALIINRRIAPYCSDSMDTVLVWLSRWLRDGNDPVAALHNFADPLPLDAATLSAFSNYQHWRIDNSTSSTADRLLHHRLDREKQKSLVAKWLGEMLDKDNLRVLALVPYGEAGNKLPEVHNQIRSYLDLALADRAAIKHIGLRFPDSRDRLHEMLEPELRLQLRSDAGENTKQLLQRHAPGKAWPLRPVLWLHWGIFGSNPAYQANLTRSQLRAWLTFTGTRLTQCCPENIRLICSLTIESAQEKHQQLNEILNDMRTELDDPHYWLRILDPVGSVSKAELLDFFKEDERCPVPIRGKLATHLMNATGGVFDTLVDHLEKAEQITYRALLNEFEMQPAAGKDNEDEAL